MALSRRTQGHVLLGVGIAALVANRVLAYAGIYRPTPITGLTFVAAVALMVVGAWRLRGASAPVPVPAAAEARAVAAAPREPARVPREAHGRIGWALGAIAVAMIAAVPSALMSWSQPHQILTFPWLGDTSLGLIAVFSSLALGGAALATAVGAAIAPRIFRTGRAVPAMVVLVLGGGAAMWGGLYAFAVSPGPAIPIFDWLFWAVPIGLIALLARTAAYARTEAIGAALLGAVPVAGPNMLGWSLYGDATFSVFPLLAGGFGCAVGLLPVALVRRAPQPSASS